MGRTLVNCKIAAGISKIEKPKAIVRQLQLDSQAYNVVPIGIKLNIQLVMVIGLNVRTRQCLKLKKRSKIEPNYQR